MVINQRASSLTTHTTIKNDHSSSCFAAFKGPVRMHKTEGPTTVHVLLLSRVRAGQQPAVEFMKTSCFMSQHILMCLWCLWLSQLVDADMPPSPPLLQTLRVGDLRACKGVTTPTGGHPCLLQQLSNNSTTYGALN
jgi:hypothetical protein